MTAPTNSERTWRAHLLPLAILALVLLVSIVVRIRLLDAPLERDEGEHGYLARTMLDGYPPWLLAYNLKLPGTDTMYAAIMAVFSRPRRMAAAVWPGKLISTRCPVDI